MCFKLCVACALGATRGVGLVATKSQDKWSNGQRTKSYVVYIHIGTTNLVLQSPDTPLVFQNRLQCLRTCVRTMTRQGGGYALDQATSSLLESCPLVIEKRHGILISLWFFTLCLMENPNN